MCKSGKRLGKAGDMGLWQGRMRRTGGERQLKDLRFLVLLGTSDERARNMTCGEPRQERPLDRYMIQVAVAMACSDMARTSRGESHNESRAKTAHSARYQKCRKERPNPRVAGKLSGDFGRIQQKSRRDQGRSGSAAHVPAGTMIYDPCPPSTPLEPMLPLATTTEILKGQIASRIVSLFCRI